MEGGRDRDRVREMRRKTGRQRHGERNRDGDRQREMETKRTMEGGTEREVEIRRVQSKCSWQEAGGAHGRDLGCVQSPSQGDLPERDREGRQHSFQPAQSASTLLAQHTVPHRRGHCSPSTSGEHRGSSKASLWGQRTRGLGGLQTKGPSGGTTAASLFNRQPEGLVLISSRQEALSSEQLPLEPPPSPALAKTIWQESRVLRSQSGRPELGTAARAGEPPHPAMLRGAGGGQYVGTSGAPPLAQAENSAIGNSRCVPWGG